MPDYKRKKVHKSFKAKRERTNKSNDIIMNNTKKGKGNIIPDNDIKVVRGAKLKQKHRNNTLLATIAVICSVCIVLSLILPVSLYENIVNSIALLGHGSYPANISGSAVINTVSSGSYYYVLTDTNISAYSNSGKKIFSEMHGFSNPIISVTNTRALVFDQGGKSIYIYNLSGQIDSIETENEIITANICRSGSFAVATHSDNYTSAVYVFNKNCEQIYNWNSAKDIVNNVLLNTAGNKLAVSTLNAVSGQYSSQIKILNFKSADALFTLDMGTDVVLYMQNTGNGISAVTDNKYKFISWKKFTTNEIASSGEINICHIDKKCALIVFNRTNDRSDNTVVLISKKGVKVSEFKVNNIITDILYTRNRVYYMAENKLNIVDKNGVLLRSNLFDYDAVKFEVLGANSLAVITEKQIIKADLEKGE